MNSDNPYLPPSPSPDFAEQSTKAKSLANWSVLLAIVPVAYTAVEMQLSRARGVASSPPLFVAIGTTLAIVVSFTLGIAALGTRRGRKGVLLPALCGLIFSGVMLSLAATGFMRARQNAFARIAEKEQNEAVMKQALAEQKDGKVSPKKTNSAKMVETAAKMSGKAGAALHAASELVAKLEEADRALEAARQKLNPLGNFLPVKLTTRAGLTQWRAALKTVIAASERYLQVEMNGDSFLQEALRRAQLTDMEISTFIAGWHRGRDASQEHALINKMRTNHLRMTRANLAIVNLLEAHFGAWKPSPDGMSFVLPQPAAVAEFNRLVSEVKSGAQEIVQASAALQALRQNPHRKLSQR